MINVAIVGYSRFMNLPEMKTDLVIQIPKMFEIVGGVLNFCYVDVIEDRPDNVCIDSLVNDMIKSNPQVLHYTDFRDHYRLNKAVANIIRPQTSKCSRTNSFDNEEEIINLLDINYLIGARKKNPKIPILLTSGIGYSKDIIELTTLLNVRYLPSPFNIKEYYEIIRELSLQKAGNDIFGSAPLMNNHPEELLIN